MEEEALLTTIQKLKKKKIIKEFHEKFLYANTMYANKFRSFRGKIPEKTQVSKTDSKRNRSPE